MSEIEPPEKRGSVGNSRATSDLIQALQDECDAVRRDAAEALGKSGEAAAVPALLQALKDRDWEVRRHAADALKNIGVPAVPGLIEALQDQNWIVRCYSAEALGKLAEVSAVPALIKALKDENRSGRRGAAAALGKIGEISSVPALAQALQDIDVSVRTAVVRALRHFGGAETLSRKILSEARFSAQERNDVLEKLRCAGYLSRHAIWPNPSADTRRLCKTVLKEEDAEARAGAQAVLAWLDQDRYLLLAAQPDTVSDPRELLRASHGGASEGQPETLLRGAEAPIRKAEPSSQPRALWERLFGKRSG